MAGFDNEKYLLTQSQHIQDRIAQFGGKLYLEFGGKLFDDYHASRVLPGFEPDSKLRMLEQLRDKAEIIIAINAGDIEKNKVRGAGGGDYHQGMGGLDILTAAKALVADNFGDVVGIAVDGIVAVDPQAQLLQAELEGVSGGLAGVAGDHHTTHIQTMAPELVDKAEHVAVVGDAQVAPPNLRPFPSGPCR